ncbi:hypothetical protein DICPUDRAFT_146827 [Dictyostelium purpureum]|uniref:DUF8206 domain-containing protein n=1 Tax=Dictyostelium purpureum TaxID=5786 RepID=F0Z6Z9_DICPU|nr:uncharacterized protein DICPUDRAFT_146827 [Dictyostelium purpureum]EGC40244.1 hypothetical protein DICPUDRAFT_146827 [Dictyostelium purpureum]|eukprot:XP_003283180.1 hypothetical protein DICPUDRAFT_146827 [Dictyostelium purpureum]
MKDYYNINDFSTVFDFINKVSAKENTFKKSISELIVAIRGCTKDISSLGECVTSYISSEYSSNGIIKFLELSHQVNLKNQLSFIQEIKALNIDIISKTMNKSEIIKKSNNNCRLYILNFYNSTRTMSQTWDPIYISTFIAKYNEKRTNTKFAIIDLEIHNSSPNQEKSPNDSTSKVPFIELYINQKLKQSNFKINHFSNFAERFKETDFNFNYKAPMDTPFLRLKCPCKDCSKVPKEWKCLICDEDLKYSTKTLYCECGSYPVTSCSYKCCEPEHDQPTTVCTNLTCVKISKDEDGNEIIHYAQRCHVGCYDAGPAFMYKSDNLKNCWAIDKKNSITGYVDTVIEYLKMCIKTVDPMTDRTYKKSLKKNLLIFEEQNRILQPAVSNCSELITVDQVPVLIEKLKKLPINGPTLKLHIEGNETDQMTSNYKPIVIRPKEK